ncbi:MAG: hypothetical protein A3D92_20690 [Bacteroidetes bacterium RIFCSPHIGHO2_02_FULL_44_7]|nr:MAG: hypothetical protein A3D92_20690 [Bacteroidetes bacterium RIFCSPHIGHO2_02_FULL_44_7]
MGKSGSVFVLLMGFSLVGAAQEFKLSPVLQEISGLESLDGDHFVAINDGGHAAELYVLNLRGEIEKTVKVLGASNQDWEDLTSDGTFLYVGDIGNNLNKRRDLCVYKIPLQDIRQGQEVTAEKIAFNYSEQVAFPPDPDQKRYDAEGLAYYQGSLWIFTKVNDTPWSGKTLIYKLGIQPGNYTLSMNRSIFIGDGGWWSDAVTSADQHGGFFFLTTYNRILKYDLGQQPALCTAVYNFPESTQKESILIYDECSWVADEYQTFLGGGKLYKIPLSDFKKWNSKTK